MLIFRLLNRNTNIKTIKRNSTYVKSFKIIPLQDNLFNEFRIKSETIKVKLNAWKNVFHISLNIQDFTQNV